MALLRLQTNDCLVFVQSKKASWNEVMHQFYHLKLELDSAFRSVEREMHLSVFFLDVKLVKLKTFVLGLEKSSAISCTVLFMFCGTRHPLAESDLYAICS